MSTQPRAVACSLRSLPVLSPVACALSLAVWGHGSAAEWRAEAAGQRPEPLCWPTTKQQAAKAPNSNNEILFSVE